MPADFQVECRVQRSDGALGVPGILQPDVLEGHVGRHSLGLLDVVPRGGDRDIGVVARHVLPQKWRVHTVRDGNAVPDNAFGNPHQDAVRALPRVELGAGQTAGQQRDDDDRDQDDRLPVEESPTALFLDCGRLGLGWCRGEAVAVGHRRVAEAAGHRRVAEAVGHRWGAAAVATSRSAPHREAGTRTDLFGRRFRPPFRTREPSRRRVGWRVAPALPTWLAGVVAAAASSPARFCLISGVHWVADEAARIRPDTPT